MSSDSSSTSTTFPRKLQEDCTPNIKYVDVLDEDKPIRGQKYVLLSFVSPEDVIINKEALFFSKFIEVWNYCFDLRLLQHQLRH